MISPGDIIRELIDAKRMTVKQAAEAIGCSRQMLHGVLIGNNRISPWMAQQTERVFGTDAEKMLQYQASWEWAGFLKERPTYEPIGGKP